MEGRERFRKRIYKIQLKSIINYILADDNLKVRRLKIGKNYQDVINILLRMQKNMQYQGVACISDDTFYGWIREYYALDDQKSCRS